MTCKIVSWLREQATGPMTQNPEHIETCGWLSDAAEEIERLQSENKQLSEADGLPTAGAQYVHALNTIVDLRAIVEKFPIWTDELAQARNQLQGIRLAGIAKDTIRYVEIKMREAAEAAGEKP